MKRFINGKMLVGTLATASVLMCISLTIILLQHPASDPGLKPADLGQAAMTVIVAPTSTPNLGVAPTFTPSPLPPTATPTPLPGAIGLGAFVQISGTEGQGLRLRAGPGLGNDQLFLGYDSEVYQVVDGPVDADGHTWWKLTAPYDATRTGWAVQDYLTVIQSP
jgi:hypothetical protein